MIKKPLQVDTDLHSYDHYIVTFSGGKDSLACLLWLIASGVDKRKIEIWHHDVDGVKGMEVGASNFMDWPVTTSYCEAVADHLQVPIFFSWRGGGFRREMMRDNERTSPVFFEHPLGDYGTPGSNQPYDVSCAGGTNGPRGTRKKFPQASADLSVRWCSASLKGEVGRAALRNQDRFYGKRTLILSGERAEESPARAKYKQLEPDATDLRDSSKRPRHVDRLRPVLYWTEEEVWRIIADFGIIPHPAYYLGWSRCSCLFCIFGNKDQFASAAEIATDAFYDNIVRNEKKFGTTIKRNAAIDDYALDGLPYEALLSNEELAQVAMSDTYLLPIYTTNWQLPAGAFGDGRGPS